MSYRKAQVGETVTWVVATIIIIVILVVSIFIVSSTTFSNSKKLESKNTQTDLLVTKSLLGYLLSKDGSTVQVFEQLKDKKTYVDAPSESVKIDETFFQKILFDLYKEEYSFNQILFRINSEFCKWEGSSKCNNERILFNQGGLPSNKGEARFFYDNIKLKNWGHETKNTVLELMLN